MLQERMLREKYETFLKFLEKKKLKRKDSTLIVQQNRRVRIFRFDEFQELIKENKHEVQKLIKHIEFTDPIDSPEGFKLFFETMLAEKLIIKLERHPDEDKPYKWPKKLAFCKDQKNISEKGFYMFTIEPKQSKYLGFLIIGGIAAICLFQIWPLWLKIFIFYAALILLYVLLGIIILRLVVYSVFRVLGIDFWILPNLFADAGFLESFKPVVSVEKCQDNKWGYLLRLIFLVVIAWVLYRLSLEPDIITDYGNMTKQSFEDIADWGYLKLEGKSEQVATTSGFKRPGDDMKKHIEDLLREDLENEKKAKEKKQKFDEEPKMDVQEPPEKHDSDSSKDEPDPTNISDSERDPADE